MYKTFSIELAGRTLSVDIGRVAAQANGAAFMHYGGHHRAVHRHCEREAERRNRFLPAERGV